MLERELIAAEAAAAATSAAAADTATRAATAVPVAQAAADLVPPAQGEAEQRRQELETAEVADHDAAVAVDAAAAAVTAAQQQVDVQQQVENDYPDLPDPPPEEPPEVRHAREAVWRTGLKIVREELSRRRKDLAEATARLTQRQARRATTAGQVAGARTLRDEWVSRVAGLAQEAAVTAAARDAAVAAAAAAVGERDRAAARADHVRGWVAELDRDPFDRPAMETTAAAIGAELETARRELESLTSRRAELDAALAALTAQLADAQATADHTTQTAAERAAQRATTADALAATAPVVAEARGRLVATRKSLERTKNNPPSRQDPSGHFMSQQEWADARAEWGANLELAAGRQADALTALTAAENDRNERAAAAAQAEQDAAAATQAATAAATFREELAQDAAARAAERDRTDAEIGPRALRVAELATARESATARLLGDVAADRPAVLLPLRIETAYDDTRRGDGGVDLIVRLLPTGLHVDSFERELTEDERRAGVAYHEAAAAATSPPARQAAWSAPADLLGPQRAAWVARVTDPADPLDTGKRAAAWTRAPRAALLPDRFVVVGRDPAGGTVFTAWGTALPAGGPAVGPDPGADPSAPGAVPLADGAEWMHDPAAAVAAGMAVRVPLSAEQAAVGLARIVVVGLGAGVADGAAALTALLEAQHYTAGLALVAPGTPSNNTADAAAGYRVRDPDGTRGLRTERGEPLVIAGDGADGDRLAAALGVPASVFAHVSGADARDRETAELVRAAVGQVAGGALAGEMAAAGVTTIWPYAEGPLPTIRVGAHPLGVLPAGSLRRWVPQATDPERATEVAARSVLLRRAATRGRPLPVRAVDDLDGVLMRTPSADWVDPAGTVPVRPDPQALTLLATTTRADLADERFPAGAAPPSSLLYLLLRAARLADPDDAAAVARLTRLAERPADAVAARVAGLLDVASHRDDAWATALATRRLGRIRSTAPVPGAFGWVEDVPPAPAPGAGAAPATLGHLLAPSPAHAVTAAVLRSGWAPHRAEVDTALAVDLSSARVRVVTQVLDGVRAGQSPGAMLGYRFERDLVESGLGALVAPLRVVAGLTGQDAVSQARRDVVELERALVTAEVPLTAARTCLQEAETELAAATLHEADAGLVRDQAVQAVQAVDDRISGLGVSIAGLEAELVVLNRTVAARVPKGPPRQPNIPGRDDADWVVLVDVDESDQMSEDRAQAVRRRNQVHRLLPAQRAQLAQLTDVVRPAAEQNRAAAQAVVDRWSGTVTSWTTARDAATGVLQAADAEVRRLGDQLAPLREKLAVAADEQWSRVVESVTAHDVVDGLALHRRARAARSGPAALWDGSTIPFGQPGTGLPDPGTPAHTVVLTCLDRLSEIVDALADALLAESVHQLVAGQPDRAGATLEALAAGTPPPTLDVARSPRGGIGSIHRVLLLVDPDPQPAWSASGSVRGRAEPRLDAWLSRLLPDPATVQIPVLLRVADGAEPVVGLPRTVTLELGALGLGPLDVVLAVDAAGTSGELERRIAGAALASAGDLPPGVVAVPEPDVAGPGAAFVDVLVAAAAAGELLGRVRALGLADLAVPGRTVDGSPDTDELTVRADAAAAAAVQAADRLDAALATAGTDPAAALLAASRCGLPTALPDPGEPAAVLAERAGAARTELRRRLGAAAVEPDPAARIRLVLGEHQPVLPLLRPAEPEPVTHLLADPDARLGGGTRPDVTSWLTDAAAVRPALAALSEALGVAEALATGERMALRVGQLPYRAEDRWVGLPLEGPDRPPLPGRVGVVVQGTHRPGEPVCGLLVDEWSETVPAAAETAAVTFHVETPHARAPKTVLVAVPPDLAPPGRSPDWDLDSLLAVLEETMELARTRVAAPEDPVGVAVGLSWNGLDVSRAVDGGTG